MDKFETFQELGLGSRLKRLSDTLMKEITVVYKNLGFDFDPYLFPVFKTISEEKKITTSVLTEKLRITQPAITQAIDKLQKKGLLVSENDIEDKRKKILSLSNKGKQDIEKLMPLWNVINKTLKKITNENKKGLIQHINDLEKITINNNLSKMIIDEYQNYIIYNIEIIPFKKEYSKLFRDLNIEWLEKYFVVEPHDSELLENCEENIINKGGHIFFASINNKIIGCFSFIKLNELTYELGKMAVSPEFQGRKIGQKMLKYAIDYGKSKNWRKIILYSNTKLENAIYLYKKYGFIEIPLEENTPYLRSNIKMEVCFDS